MLGKYIYVFQDGERDYSRWLNIGIRSTGDATIYLSDLCHPGRVSALKNVACDLSLLRDGLAAGAVQIVTDNGYFLARRDGDRIRIEFRSQDDPTATKVEVPADEVLARIDALSVTPAT